MWRNNPQHLCVIVILLLLIFIFSDWPLTPEQWAAAAGGNNTSVRSAAGGWRLCWAADGWWRWWRATFCAQCQRAKAAHARKGSFPPGYTVAGCSSPRSTGGSWRRHSSLTASSFPITVRSPDFVCADLQRLSTHLSFDPSGDYSVLKRVRDTIRVSVVKTYDQDYGLGIISHGKFVKAITQNLNLGPVLRQNLSDCMLQFVLWGFGWVTKGHFAKPQKAIKSFI